jgi:hypothetical protein
VLSAGAHDDASVYVCGQVENDKSELFYVLLEVPVKVVKHLHRIAQAGYDKLRVQLETENGSGEGDEQAMESTEVCRVCEYGSLARKQYPFPNQPPPNPTPGGMQARRVARG